MDFNNLTDKDINTLGSYWGIFVHANCRHLWYKYTGVRTFADLNISVHDRDFVKDIVGIPLSVTDAKLYFKRGEERLRIQCDYSKYEKGELKEYKNAYISTSGEILVEAGKQFTPASFPFSTVIVIDDKGYYRFT